MSLVVDRTQYPEGITHIQRDWSDPKSRFPCCLKTVEEAFTEGRGRFGETREGKITCKGCECGHFASDHLDEICMAERCICIRVLS